jgi:hypothetical protein
MENKITTELLFQQIYSFNGIQPIPEGYEFLRLHSDNNGGLYMILKKLETLMVVKDKLKESYDKSLESQKNYLEQQYKEKINKLDLEKTFSEIIKNFKIGDTCYYYQKPSYKVEIENCIKSFSISEIHLTKQSIQVDGKDDYLNLRILGWSNNQNWKDIYKTKELAISENKEAHEKLMKEFEEKIANAEKEKKEKEKLAEEEILRKAEEIKKKNKE